MRDFRQWASLVLIVPMILASSFRIVGAQDPIPQPPSRIDRVGTSTPAFIGFTAKAGRKLVNNPVLVGSMRDFERQFGGGEESPIEVDVDESGGRIAVTVNAPAVPAHMLYYSVQLYFANGGGPCYIVSVGDFSTPFTTGRFEDAIVAVGRVDGLSLLVIPDLVLGSAPQAAGIADAALKQARDLGDRFVILDVWNAQPGGIDDIGKVSATFRSSITNETSLRGRGAVYYPYLDTSLPIAFSEQGITIRSHTGSSGTVIQKGTSIGDKVVKRDRKDIYGAVISKLDQTFVRIPPSGGVAGAYAATDKSKGVWKTPANVSLSRVSGPAVDVNSTFGEALNVDASTGKSINAIRLMPGKGTLIWGGRTLDGNSSDYTYVSVRRTATMIEESIRRGLDWTAPSVNDANTWASVKSLVTGFLDALFRDGAFAGSSPREAYFVKVGLGETMNSSDVSSGRLIVEVGFAPLKPAEFIVLRIVKSVSR